MHVSVQGFNSEERTCSADLHSSLPYRNFFTYKKTQAHRLYSRTYIILTFKRTIITAVSLLRGC